jgi:hypothetical protein
MSTLPPTGDTAKQSLQETNLPSSRGGVHSKFGLLTTTSGTLSARFHVVTQHEPDVRGLPPAPTILAAAATTGKDAEVGARRTATAAVLEAFQRAHSRMAATLRGAST